MLPGWAERQQWQDQYLGPMRFASHLGGLNWSADHPLDYIDFEGALPEGEYGAGVVKIWDKGTYTLTDQDSDEIKFALRGEKLRGPYALVKMVASPADWLLMKMKDERDGRSPSKMADGRKEPRDDNNPCH